MRTKRTIRAAAFITILAVTGPSIAQESWNPFKERDDAPRRARPLPPATEPLPSVDRGVFDPRGAASPAGEPPYMRPWSQSPTAPPAASSVERIELQPLEPPSSGASPGLAVPGAAPLQGRGSPAPVPRSGRSEMRADLWTGLDMAALERLIAAIEVPPRSPALNALWLSVMRADATPPSGTKGPGHFPALQLEALYRSGAIATMGQRLSAGGAQPNEALIAGFQIRRDLAAGDGAAACERVRALLGQRASLPKLLLGELQILSGYCAAAEGNPKGAGLAAELAREAETEAPLALQLLDAIGQGSDAPKPKLAMPKRLLVLDYRLMEVLGGVDPVRVLQIAEPALLYALAQGSGDPRLTVAAAEAAAGINAISGEELATIYGRLALPANAAGDALFRRVNLFRQINADASARRAPLVRQLLDDARRSGLSVQMARALSAAMRGDGAEAGAAVEIAIAAGDHGRARSIAAADALSWLVLAEISDPMARGVSEGALARLEEGAQRGRFTADVLHRIATVLDALDVNVPVPLWEAASRAPQPNSGHLPETGVLPQMAEAAKKREVGHVALLAIRTIGPGGPAAAHLIALGDTIRALRRAGLEGEARAIAVEALLAGWPR